MKKIFTAIIIISFISVVSIIFPAVQARAETLKIGFVTDWEYGNKGKYTHKYPRRAIKYLNAAVDHFNVVFQPDLVVGGGDYILGSGVSKKTAERQLRSINGIFKRTNAPRLYCIGNHDLLQLSKEGVKKNLGIDYVHSATDIEGLRIITMDTNNLLPGQKKYHTTGMVSGEELAWLNGQLNTDLPVIVFSHHSPIETPQGKSWRTNILNASEVRSTLEKYGNVVAVFSGHHAVNYQTEENGIKYIIINNLTDEKARGTYADITIDASGEGAEVQMSVSQYGAKPASYNISK